MSASVVFLESAGGTAATAALLWRKCDNPLKFRLLLEVLHKTSCSGLVDIVRTLEGIVEICMDIVGAFHESEGVLCHYKLLIGRNDEDLDRRGVLADAGLCIPAF